MIVIWPIMAGERKFGNFGKEEARNSEEKIIEISITFLNESERNKLFMVLLKNVSISEMALSHLFLLSFFL
jgi:hypothetical protein